MYTEVLTPQEQIDRNVCLTLAVSIRHTLNYNKEQNQQYIAIYKRTDARVCAH